VVKKRWEGRGENFDLFFLRKTGHSTSNLKKEGKRGPNDNLEGKEGQAA